MQHVPAIDTARLALRGHRIEDLPECAAMWGDPEVTRHIGGKPFSVEETWSRLMRYVGHWTLLGYGYWLVRDRASGRFVGEVGFADWKRNLGPSIEASAQRELGPSIEGVPELGWAIATWAQGKGIATEAVLAAVAWGEPRFARTACIIDPDNHASIRVAEKCGFSRHAQASHQGHPTLVFVRPSVIS